MLTVFCKIKYLLIIVVFSLLSIGVTLHFDTPAFASDQSLENKSAFAGARASQQQPVTPVRTSSGFGVSALMAWVLNVQRDFHRQLSQAIRDLKETNLSLVASWALISLSFIYGVVHAAGPGHGKAVISSYMLAHNSIIRRGVVLSFLAAGVQAITAIVLVSAMVLAFKATGFEIKQSIGTLITLSYGLVILIGVWMMFVILQKSWHHRLAFAGGGGEAHSSHSYEHQHIHSEHKHSDHKHTGHKHSGHTHAADGRCCGHAHMPDASELEQKTSLYHMAGLVLAIGIRPCTGAILVLIFALSHGLYWAGVVSAFAMAFGTAITISTLAILAGGSRKAVLFLSGVQSVWAERLSFGLALLGAVFITLIGTILFFGSLGPTPPF